MPSIDVRGSAESAEPEHIAGTGAKVGVVLGLTVIVNEAVFAH